MKTFAFLLSFLVGSAAIAAEGIDYRHKDSALDGVAMNGAASTRTFTVDTSYVRYATIVFWFDFTHDADGVISLTCTGGPGTGDNDYTLTVCDSASTEGECAAKTSGILKSGTANLTADAKWDGHLTIVGARSLSCVAAHSGSATANDLLTVHYTVLAD